MPSYARVSDRSAVAVRLVLVALASAACSPTSDGEQSADRGSSAPLRTASAAEPRDACTLITKQEADSILGSPVTPVSRSVSQERSVCDYGPAGGPGAQRFESFSLEVHWTGGQQQIQTGRSAAKTAVNVAGGPQDEVVSQVMGLHPVEGLGDEAYFSRRAMSYVRKGDALLVFYVGGLDEPARPRWEALARGALHRL